MIGAISSNLAGNSTAVKSKADITNPSATCLRAYIWSSCGKCIPRKACDTFEHFSLSSADLILRHYVPCASTRHRHLLSMVNSMFPPASPQSDCSPNLRYPIVTPQSQLPVVALAILENLLDLPRVLQPPLFPIASSKSSAAPRLWLSASSIFACGSSREPPVLLRLASSQAEPLLSSSRCIHDRFSPGSAATSPAPLLFGL